MERRRRKELVASSVVVLVPVVLGVGTARRWRTPSSHTVTIDAAPCEPAVSVVRVGDVIT